MSRNYWATIGLLLVLLVGIGVVVWGNHIVSQRNEAARRFSFSDTAAIQGITLIEKHGDTVYRRLDMRRTSKGWRIGDTLEVFEQPLQILLKTVAGQVPRAPVPSSALRNVLRFLKEHRIEVELSFQDGRVERFYVGGPTPDQRASYMLRPGSDQPYEVFLPGFEGYLTSRYYPDMGVWQPNLVFDVRIRDLQAVQVDFWGDPGNSWRLERSMPMEKWRLATGEPVDSAQVDAYLLVYAGRFYADELVSSDSLAGLSPLAEVQLMLWSGKRYHWLVYPHRSSPLHYYVRLLHSPYFTYAVSRYAIDRLLYRRVQFVSRPS
ncbi:MAG: DUF4340 domain-containing protein [Bacteroidia bacterium]|nr:DUF4340 domain-containing protein [Bacteroidia bacterium]